jgi:hypothetical protein
MYMQAKLRDRMLFEADLIFLSVSIFAAKATMKGVALRLIATVANVISC